jgi:hypothetical protein
MRLRMYVYAYMRAILMRVYYCVCVRVYYTYIHTYIHKCLHVVTNEFVLLSYNCTLLPTCLTYCLFTTYPSYYLLGLLPTYVTTYLRYYLLTLLPTYVTTYLRYYLLTLLAAYFLPTWLTAYLLTHLTTYLTCDIFCAILFSLARACLHYHSAGNAGSTPCIMQCAPPLSL